MDIAVIYLLVCSRVGCFWRKNSVLFIFSKQFFGGPGVFIVIGN